MSDFKDTENSVPEDVIREPTGEPLEGGEFTDDPTTGYQAEADNYEPEEAGQSGADDAGEAYGDFPDYSPEEDYSEKDVFIPNGPEPAREGEPREENEPIPDNDPDAVEEDAFSGGGDEPEPAGEGDAPGETGGSLSTDENEKKPLEPYAARRKKSPSSVINSKPNVLNRRLILYIIGGVVIFALIFATFILPLIQSNTKKPDAKRKQTPAAVSPADYYSLVPRTDARNLDNESAAPDPSAGKFWEEDETEDDVLKTLPPIDERYQSQNPPPAAAPPAASGGGGSGYVRPDTRNDRLQEKNIQGIKGITPTQQQYLSGPGRLDAAELPGQQQIDPNNANPYAQFGMPSKEDYTAQMLALQQGQGQQQSPGGGSLSYAAQNDQSGKTAFYNRGRENSGNGYWLPAASIWQGAIFEATLTSRINTDLPGECTALISKNVYSSQDGRYLLIPQNSRLLGTYNSSISYSQKRVQVGWHTLIRPDGYYINLGNMQAADPHGAAGLPGRINEHPWQYLKAIILLSAMNIVNSELNYSMAETNNQYVQNVMANTQEIANLLGGKIIDRAMDVQPTITIKEGTKINIVANYNLVLPPIEPYPVKYPYRRGE
jgi:type IV secretion system protein VirB10